VLAWIALAFFALEVASLFNTDSANVSLALARLEQHQAFVLVPLIFIDVLLDDNQLDKVLAWFTASCLVMALIAVAINMWISVDEYGTLFHEWRFSHDRISEVIGLQAVYFAMYLALAIVAIVRWLITGTYSRGIRIVLIILVAGFSILVTALGARSILVALVVIVVLNLVYYARVTSNYRLLVAAAVVPVLFIILVATNPVVRTRFTDLLSAKGSNYDGYSARTEIWRPGVKVIAENFWIGVGTGDEQQELDKKFIEVGYGEGVQLFNMHNAYLQAMLGLGLPGLVVLLALLGVQFRRAWRSASIVYFSFLLLFALASASESMLNRNKGTLFFLIFSFLFYSMAAKHESAQSPRHPSVT
jgi:O-antigen ligase